jgi:MSHA biogenesis protein MshJ
MNKIQQVLKQFNALSLRERVLAVAALLGILYFVFDLALIRPQETKTKLLRAQISEKGIELDTLRKGLEAVATQAKTDPLAAQRAELASLRKKSAQAEAVISRASGDVRLGDVMRALVASRPGLTLVSIKTLPVATLLQGALVPATQASAASGAGSTVQALYRHGVEVTVQGSYPALMQYLQDAEHSANGVFWSSVKLDVVSYPASTLKLTVFTLSPQSESPLG